MTLSRLRIILHQSILYIRTSSATTVTSPSTFLFLSHFCKLFMGRKNDPVSVIFCSRNTERSHRNPQRTHYTRYVQEYILTDFCMISVCNFPFTWIFICCSLITLTKSAANVLTTNRNLFPSHTQTFFLTNRSLHK